MKAHPEAAATTSPPPAHPAHLAPEVSDAAHPHPHLHPRRHWSLWLLAAGVVLVHLWLLERWLSAISLPPGLPAVTQAVPAPTAEQTGLTAPAPAVLTRTTPGDAAPTAPAITAPSVPASPSADTQPRPISPTGADRSAVVTPPDPSRGEKHEEKPASPLINKQQFATSSIAPSSTRSRQPAEQPAAAGPTARDTATDTVLAQQPNAASALAATAPAGSEAPSAPQNTATGPSPDGHAAEPTLTQPHRLVIPPTVSLVLDVRATRKGLTLPASSTLTLQHDGTAYQARLEIRAALAGARVQTSRGTLTPGTGLVPTRFGDKTKSEQAAHFDRTVTPAAIRFSANTPDAPFPAGAQDRLSVLFQLAAMMAGEPRRYALGSQINLYVAGARDAEVWSLAVGATEALELPAGRQSAIHLQRLPSHPYDNRVEIWLAPNMHYLPVRVRWTQANGDVVDQQLASVTWQP